jgi:hypothetical protein
MDFSKEQLTFTIKIIVSPFWQTDYWINLTKHVTNKVFNLIIWCEWNMGGFSTSLFLPAIKANIPKDVHPKASRNIQWLRVFLYIQPLNETEDLGF